MPSSPPRLATFWMRWYGGADGDPRPTTYPTPIEWWCTGETADGKNTICALVTARNEKAAWAEVSRYWPEYEPSFCDAKEDGWRPPACRFPPKEK
jgi:hypothetical protein